MKKIFITMVALMAFTLSANAQFDLGSIVNKVVDTATGKSDVTSESIIGTWTYQRPAIILESDDVLQKLGGAVATSAAQKEFATQLEKVGIKAGALSFTFKSDASFSMVVKKKTLTGTWTLTDKKLKLKFSNAVPVTVTTAMSSGKLQMVFNSSLILKIASAVGSKVGNSVVSTISSLASKYDGMQTGLELEKK